MQYLELLEFEKQLDAVCARKRLEYQAATQKPVATYKKNLRILVSNIVELGDEGMVSWTFKVDGRLMDHRDKDESVRRSGAAPAALVQLTTLLAYPPRLAPRRPRPAPHQPALSPGAQNDARGQA